MPLMTLNYFVFSVVKDRSALLAVGVKKVVGTWAFAE